MESNRLPPEIVGEGSAYVLFEKRRWEVAHRWPEKVRFYHVKKEGPRRCDPSRLMPSSEMGGKKKYLWGDELGVNRLFVIRRGIQRNNERGTWRKGEAEDMRRFELSERGSLTWSALRQKELNM